MVRQHGHVINASPCLNGTRTHTEPEPDTSDRAGASARAGASTRAKASF